MSTVPSNYQTLADAVLEKRLYSPLYSTQEKMAEHLGISINEYKKIEYGHIPKTCIFMAICRRLELEPMDYWREILQKGGFDPEEWEDEPEETIDRKRVLSR